MQIKNSLVAAGTLFLLSVLHTNASPVSDVSGQPSLTSEFTTLHLGLHLDNDTADLNNLKAMFNRRRRDGAHAPIPRGLSRTFPFISVTCENANTLAVAFTDADAFDTAIKDWSTYPSGFLLISYVSGCGVGTDSAERSFHFVSHFAVSDKDLRITCRTAAMEIHETLDSQEAVRLHVATYRLDDPAGPSPRNGSQGASAPEPEPPASSASSREVVHESKRGLLGNIFKGVGKAALFVVSVQAPIQLSLYFSGSFVGDSNNGFKQANMGVDMDLNITLVLGIHANYKTEDDKDLLSIDAPIPGASIKISKLLTIGPAVGLAVGAGYSIELDGYFAVGFTCAWKKVLDAEVTATLAFELYTKLSVKLVVSVLPAFTKKLTAEAALVEKLSFELKAAISTEASTCARAVPYLTGTIESLLYVKVPFFDEIKLHDPFSHELFGVCLVYGESAAAGAAHMIDAGNSDGLTSGGNNSEATNERLKAALTSQKETSPSDLGEAAGIVDDEDDDFVLDWASDGKCIMKSLEAAESYSGWRISEGIIFATSDGDALYIHPSMPLPDGNGTIGRLFVQDPDTAPADWNPLFVGKPKDSEFVVVVDDKKDIVYYMVYCTFEDGNSETFLTTNSDPDEGVVSLMDQPQITGKGAVDCE
ncbi:hypothetical protein C8R44DRAFT_893269 [Mycena epipterygia]|nr:hypothetical protein C8R44DRAFT_893269 [Mycena epipterygia]